MAQKLKTEVREAIMENALECFLELGYNNTSMKMIAQKSNVAVGNIYNYFKDKEALYDSLAMPVFERINRLFDEPPKAFPEGVDKKTNEFVEIYKSNKKVFVMLLENSSNTKFENSKAMLIDSFAAAIVRFVKLIANKQLNQEDTIFINAYTCSIINGIITILKQEADESIKLGVLFSFVSSMKSALIKTIKIYGG